MLLAAATGVAVIFEAKVLSDISTHVTFDLARNQLARSIDVMLEVNSALSAPLSLRGPGCLLVAYRHPGHRVTMRPKFDPIHPMASSRHESTSPGVCQCCAMGISDIAVQHLDEGNSEPAVRFLIEWVSDGEAEARSYLADHAEPDGASLIAMDGSDVIGYVAMVWESNYDGFRSRGIPLVHQVAVTSADRVEHYGRRYVSRRRGDLRSPN